MSIDVRRVIEAMVKEGLAAPCALCNHYWSAWDRKEDKSTLKAECGKTECGGPGSGKDFPSYEGSLPKGDWGHICFVCGRPNDGVTIKAESGTRLLGLCRQHTHMSAGVMGGSGLIRSCTIVGGLHNVDDKTRSALRKNLKGV